MVNSTSTRNPAATRRRILSAAAAEFARAGFAGGRVDRIARAAQANKRMLYHYFGDKRGLRAAVMDEGFLDGLPRDQADRLRLWAVLEEPGTGVPRPPAPAGLGALMRRMGAGRPGPAEDAELWERVLAWGALVLRCTSPAGDDHLLPVRHKPRIRLKSAAPP